MNTDTEQPRNDALSTQVILDNESITSPKPYRWSSILSVVSSDNSESDRGNTCFTHRLNNSDQVYDCAASWQLIEKSPNECVMIIRLLCGHFPIPGRQYSETEKKHNQRVQESAGKHDGTLSYWLLEYVKDQIKESQSQLSQILSRHLGSAIKIRVQTDGVHKTELVTNIENLNLLDLSNYLEEVQINSARLAKGIQYWNGFVPLSSIYKIYPFLRISDDCVRLETHKGVERFGIGTLTEPITNSPLQTITPLFSIIDNPNGTRCLYGHYGDSWEPQGHTMEEMNVILADELRVTIPTVTITTSPANVESNKSKTKIIDFIQLSIDNDIEDASYLITNGILPKIIDGKLKWNDKSLERKEIFDPETKKSVGFIFRSVIFNEETQKLEFRFFRTRSEAASARISKSKMDELIQITTAEQNKSASQKFIEELGRTKTICPTEQMLLQILEIELQRQTPVTARKTAIESINVVWEGASEESCSPIFFNRIRQIAFNADSQQIPQLIKSSRSIEEAFKHDPQLSTHGPSSIANVLLLVELLKVIQKVSTQDQSTSIETLINKLNRSFEHKYNKAGPWAKTEVPIVRELSKLRIKYALPELFDEDK